MYNLQENTRIKRTNYSSLMSFCLRSIFKVNCYFNWLGVGNLGGPTHSLVSVHVINPNTFKSDINCLVFLNEFFVRLFFCVLCVSFLSKVHKCVCSTNSLGKLGFLQEYKNPYRSCSQQPQGHYEELLFRRLDEVSSIFPWTPFLTCQILTTWVNKCLH